MKLFEKFLVLLICLVQVQESVCSHFRGATFTYRAVDPSDAANLKVNSQEKACLQCQLKSRKSLSP